MTVKAAVCPMCGGMMGNADEACPNCRAIPQWQDYVHAVDFARAEIAG
jgi:RNA polymerase subunit RPABC4/transcription elongation factor Spt4